MLQLVCLSVLIIKALCHAPSKVIRNYLLYLQRFVEDADRARDSCLSIRNLGSFMLAEVLQVAGLCS